jgi:hypothetical protein
MMSPGKILYHVWHRPRAELRDLIREGGPRQRRLTREGAAAMEAATAELPSPPTGSGPAIKIHLLTGKRFWFQSAFCLYSLAISSRRTVRPTFYDDGSLQPTQVNHLQRLFPEARFFSIRDTCERLDDLLPQSRYPVLRERWKNYPNLRKLTDVHLGTTGWKLVIDSDLLFFRFPAALLQWLDQPTHPLHAVDCAESYGYSRPLMETLTGTPLAEKLNVGLCGLNSESLDWSLLEAWTAELMAREKTNYYLEQALVAMMLAGKTCTVLPESDYVTFPKPPEAMDCDAVMHHYVDVSKRWYFQKNWRNFTTRPPIGT